MCRWRKIDESDGLIYYLASEDPTLYYRRIYTVWRDYSFSETNQLIHNLKKIPIPENSHTFHHKKKAIELFSNEIITLLSNSKQQIIIVPIPPSKTKDHPEYDNRIEQVAGKVSTGLANVTCRSLLIRTKNIESHHISRAPRNPEKIYDSLRIDESSDIQTNSHTIIVLLDDVITTGAHFVASRRLIKERYRDTKIYGVFWAKAEYPIKINL